jgi:hydroxymethylglutaryl-CoA lyase
MPDARHPGNCPTRATIREVGARDGIQSLGAFIDTRHKIELIDGLGETGIPRIEVTSFVSPKAVPQLADAARVLAGIKRIPGVRYEALAPNVRGAQDAIAAGADGLVLVLTASEFARTSERWSTGRPPA